jgi:hypothetical protein
MPTNTTTHRRLTTMLLLGFAAAVTGVAIAAAFRSDSAPRDPASLPRAVWWTPRQVRWRSQSPGPVRPSWSCTAPVVDSTKG